jgi:hypothetical protein
MASSHRNSVPVPYQAVRGLVDEFTVKQLPFVTVMSRPSTASSARATAPHAQPRHVSRPHSSVSCTTPFSPKWAADKLMTTQPQRGGPSAAHQDQPAPSARKMPLEVTRGDRVGSRSSTVECVRGAVSAEAAAFEDNHALKAAVSALGSMLVRERKLKQAADEQLEQLHLKLAELGGMVEEAEGRLRGKDGGKVWRTNTKKLQNYGPLAPSSVMDPFAEEQKIMREREQRLAERERRRREKVEQGAAGTGTATHSKSAATLMHS